MKQLKILTQLSLVMILTSWGQPVRAENCDIRQWISGLEFGACPSQTGLELNQLFAKDKHQEDFRLRMTQRFSITVAQYNTDLPRIYAQWQRKQKLLASLGK